MDRVVGVPRHIVRCDSARVRGWQVRFDKPFRLFSDGLHGSAEASFQAAKRHLRKIWRPEPSHHGQLPGPPRIIRDNRGAWYAVTAVPNGAKRFYIGMDSTYTDLRKRHALKRAREAQRSAYADFQQPLR